MFQLDEANRTEDSRVDTDILQSEIETLELLRDAELEKVRMTASDDITVKAGLLSDFQNIVERKPKTKEHGIKSTVVDALNFKRDLTEAYYNGDISNNTFEKWSLLTDVALANDLEKNIKDDTGFFGGSDGFKAGSKLSSKKIRGNLNDVLSTVQRDKGKEYAVEVLDFYIDGLSDITGGDLDKLDLVNEEALNNVLRDAKRKAYLKEQGLPTYLTVGDKMKTSVGMREVVGVDDRGVPLVNYSQEDVQALERLREQ